LHHTAIVSASQLIIFVLIVAAFALGWWGRGQRAAPSLGRQGGDSLDQAVGFTLTAFQAALGLWQAQGRGGPSSDSLAAQSVAVFKRRRAALAAATLPADARPEARTAYDRAQRAADRLADGLSGFAAGSALDRDRERTLISAERALTTARLELRAATSNGSRPSP
jgi:hypothetical protein